MPTWPIYVLGTIPGLWLIYAGLTGGLGVDPVKAMEHRAGLWSLQFLMGSLTITPILRFGRVNLIRFRKALGLLAFGYLVLHFLVWMFLDLQLRWDQIGVALTKRPYIIVGMVAFAILVPLAATSFRRAKVWLGGTAWNRLHSLVYVSVILGAVHFVMQSKTWTPEVMTYLAIAIGLVAMRLLWIRQW